MTLDDIRKLAEQALEDDKRATPGPWQMRARPTWTGSDLVEVSAPNPKCAAHPERMLANFNHYFEHRADAEAIAAARTREPQLAAFALAVLAALDEWSKARDSEMNDAAHDMRADITERLRP